MEQNVSGTHLFLVLWKAANAVRRVAEANIEELGLGLTDFAVLEALLHKGPLAVNAIGRKVLLTSGSITTAIDRLEKRGLVERRGDPEDRRSRIVHLTEEGRSLIACAFERHAAKLEELAGVLSRDERADLVRTARKFGLAAGKIL
jgi:MarR family 2-MHQ and catechol resistance regulon transcriptional repressor